MLIVALEPTGDQMTIQKRRNKKTYSTKLTNGFGSLSVTLGINKSHSGNDLTSNKNWIEGRNIMLDQNELIKSPRVGIPYAKKDKNNPRRFRIKNNPHCNPVN